MKVLKVSEIIKLLEAAGWYLHRHNGTSHRQFKHPDKTGKVTVNGKKSHDITGTLLKSVEKQAGQKF